MNNANLPLLGIAALFFILVALVTPIGGAFLAVIAIVAFIVTSLTRPKE